MGIGISKHLYRYRCFWTGSQIIEVIGGETIAQPTNSDDPSKKMMFLAWFYQAQPTCGYNMI